MLVYAKNAIVNTDDFPAIFITKDIINSDKYSIIFMSKFCADANVRLNGLEYNKAVEILKSILDGIIVNRSYLSIQYE